MLRDSICQKYSRVSDNSNIGEHSLRISTRELVRQKAYQGIVIHIQYASPVGWAPEVEDEMVDGVIRMVESMVEAPPH